MDRKPQNSVTYDRYIFKSFYEEDCIVKITVNLRRLQPDEDTASSTPQPAYKTGYNSLSFYRHIFKAYYDGKQLLKGDPMSKRTWRQIEDSRDRRLWITQVGLPIAGGCLFWMSDPERREWTIQKLADAKDKFVGKVQGFMNR